MKWSLDSSFLDMSHTAGQGDRMRDQFSVDSKIFIKWGPTGKMPLGSHMVLVQNKYVFLSSLTLKHEGIQNITMVQIAHP